VHRHVAGHALVATLGAEQDADLRGQVGAGLVQVGRHDRGLDTGHALDLDLLADGRVRLVEQLLDGPAVLEVALEQGVGVCRAGGDGLREHLVGQRDELLALGDEVGLAEDLDEGAHAALGLGCDQAVGSRAALALGDALEALDAQDLGGPGAVALGLVESLLDVEHAGTGGLAQRLDVSGGVVRHRCCLAFVVGVRQCGSVRGLRRWRCRARR
jgi:hypothetical protein